MKYREITVPAGIGDNLWLLMKLINSGEKFDFVLPDGRPQRGHQIFELLPQVANSCRYAPGLTYKKLMRDNIQSKKRNWRQVTDKSFSLCMNEHLEKGNRIEAFLPDLSTTFKLDYDTDHYRSEVENELPGNQKYIGLYGSSYSTSRAWGFWNAEKWLELAQLVSEHGNYTFVVIGADFDLDLGSELIKLLDDAGLPYKNLIGFNLGKVVEVLKRLHYFFGFPSGLSVVANTVDCPLTMFYPPHLIKMMNTWALVEDITSGKYKGCQFCSPQQIIEWVIQNKMI